jgi:serine/threonine protein kinase/formylglycine-generating enzyme required for sulfatase activity
MPVTSIPELIGNYRILKMLGRGGMGVVYLAEDERLRRLVAIKVMLDEYAQHELARARFQREARAMAKVKSDHIVTIHLVDEENNSPFFVMEYLQGLSLESYLRSNPELNLSTIIRISLEIAQGLSDAHSHGLIHRDIKPDNLFLEAPKGRIKVLDFGLARHLDDATQLTHTGKIMGTPYYMAPEQAEGKKETDHRADIFSFGVVLYRLCSGELPFQGDTIYSVIAALLQHNPLPVEKLNSKIPIRLSRLIERMISKDMQLRPQTIDEVRTELQAIKMSVNLGQAETPMLLSETVPIESSFSATVAKSDVRTLSVVQTKGKPETIAKMDERTLPFVPAKKKPWKWLVGVGAAIFAIVALVIIMGQGPNSGSTENPPGSKRDNAKDDAGSKDKIAGGNRKKPEALKAPFSPEEAKNAQKEWAEYLGREVTEWIDLGNEIKQEMVLIPPGEYEMGAPEGEEEAHGDERPRRKIKIEYPFYVSRFEVMQKQFMQVMDGENPGLFRGSNQGSKAAGMDTNRFPVEYVSWREAKSYCQQLRKPDWIKGDWRLPSEAEWEYACRAGTVTPFHFGTKLNGEQANCYGNRSYGTSKKGPTLAMTTEVGKYGANAFGLHDMHGNVWEWCEDYYGRYETAPKNGNARTTKEHDNDQEVRIVRGGSWENYPAQCRSSTRLHFLSNAKYWNLGFRVVCVPKMPPDSK